MIECVFLIKVLFFWVVVDSVYGVGDIEIVLCCVGKGYVLGVSFKYVFNFWGKVYVVSGMVGSIVEDLLFEVWQCFLVGVGIKGEWFYDWVYFDFVDFDVGEFNVDFSGVWIWGLLI